MASRRKVDEVVARPLVAKFINLLLNLLFLNLSLFLGMTSLLDACSSAVGLIRTIAIDLVTLDVTMLTLYKSYRHHGMF